MESVVNFVIPNKINTLSLSVFDSDSITNSSVMEQVVGTLVKYSGVGRYESYLASTWSTRDNQKVWIFEFNKNLKTEDNVQITAESFALNLKKLLRIYSKQYSPPMFNKLRGWNQFVAGDDSQLGITVDSNDALVLTFNKTPSGVLEFLSMPYFGFYSPNDFNGDQWKDNRIIHSSGIYKVKKFTEESIELNARPDFSLFKPTIPNKVYVTSSAGKDLNTLQLENSIVLLKDSDNNNYKGFVKYNTTPTLLSAIVLSPFLKPFDSERTRKAFRALIRKKLSQNNPENFSSIKSNFFYENLNKFKLETDYETDEALEILKSEKNRTFKIFQQKLNDNSNSRFLMNLIMETLSEVGWEVEIETPTTLGKDWIKIGLDNSKFQLRTASVDIGGSLENWVVDMMFCSKLGISFPDKDSKICNIVKAYEEGNYLNKNEYWLSFHNVIEKESTVIPILHSGFSWIISENIEMKEVSSTMNIPRFDQLSIKK